MASKLPATFFKAKFTFYKCYRNYAENLHPRTHLLNILTRFTKDIVPNRFANSNHSDLFASI